MDRTSKSTVEATFDEIRQTVPSAKNWTILRNADSEYGLYASDDDGNLRFVVTLGATAPQALGTLNGIKVGMSIR